MYVIKLPLLSFNVRSNGFAEQCMLDMRHRTITLYRAFLQKRAEICNVTIVFQTLRCDGVKEQIIRLQTNRPGYKQDNRIDLKNTHCSVDRPSLPDSTCTQLITGEVPAKNRCLLCLKSCCSFSSSPTAVGTIISSSLDSSPKSDHWDSLSLSPSLFVVI